MDLYCRDFTDFVFTLILDGFYQIDSHKSRLKLDVLEFTTAVVRSVNKLKQTPLCHRLIYFVL